MDKINYIIFSKDRACQLDLLLRSIDRFCNNYINCYVIYKATTPEYQAGYSKLINNTPNYLCLKSILPENDFRTDTIKTVYNNLSDLFGFLTDDSVFYKNFELSPQEIFKKMRAKKCFSFSLRSGFNINKQCHYRDEGYIHPYILFEDDNIIMWDTSKYSYATNNGRPMSIDGNFFTYDELWRSLHEFSWNCPRTLDGINTTYIKPNVMSFKHSIIVNIPVNLTVGGYADNWGHFYRYSLDDLNNRFIEGKIIDLDSICSNNIYMSHHELELKLI